METERGWVRIEGGEQAKTEAEGGSGSSLSFVSMAFTFYGEQSCSLLGGVCVCVCVCVLCFVLI